MKKLSAFFAALFMLLFTACGNNSVESNVLNTDSSVTSTSEADIENNESVDTTDNMQKTEKDLSYSEDTIVSSETPSNDENNILIVYFSRRGNTDYPDDVDASTSASIVIDNDRFGTTEYIARIIQETVGGDIHLIETVTPYTADFDELREVNHSEMANNFLTELKESDLDISKYGTIFVGYPVWAMDVPQAVLSFLSRYDLSDKTVIPFCTHDGYGAGSSYGTVAAASKAKNTADGLAIEAKDVPASKNTVTNWLDSIGVVKSQGGNAEAAETAIKITIGETVLDGVIYDTALAQEIKEYFPLTVSMAGYGGREYYGGVDFYPKNLESGKKTFENGDITYCEAHHNMAIFYAQTDNPTLSVDVIPIGKVTSELSVFETLGNQETITFSLAE